jgi:(R,R)-butanediol dehydrogenase/meso-butanediol dehydrogenase/diacetyl reductase
MRGVVFKGDREIEFMEFPDPKPGPDEVVLEIKASGLCGSDLKFYREPAGAAMASFGFGADRLDDSSPAIIGGHEPCGVIAELGSGVDPRAFKVGDRVLQFHYQGCGHCPSCRSGWFQLCVRGAKIFGATANGGHARYMVAPAETLAPLPENVSFVAGAAIACGTGTSFSAIRRANITAADTVAIFGMGPIGLSSVQFAKAMGCRVIAVDIAHDRLEHAKRLGADGVIDSTGSDPVEVIRDLTGGGANVALETSGAPAARTAAAQCLAVWGRMALVGMGGDFTVEAGRDLILRQITVIGSYTFSNTGLLDCAKFVSNHSIDVDAIFTDHWALDDAVAAYSEFDKQLRGKAVIEF